MKIVIAEDAALIRAGLVEVLASSGYDIIEAVDNAQALETCIMKLGEVNNLPDIVVSDVRMPPMNSDDGLQAAIRIRRHYPGLPITLLSGYVGGPYLRCLVEDEASQGGIGYLLKERISHVREFLQSLNVVAAGGVVIDPDVLRSALQRERGDLPGGHLSSREREVIELMAQGLSNTDIRKRLALSPQAVSKHIASIFQKMNLGTHEENRRVRAVLRWIQSQPVVLPDD